MREVYMQTTGKVGDGSTTARVLAQTILKNGLEAMGDETDALRDHSQNLAQLALSRQSKRTRVLKLKLPRTTCGSEMGPGFIASRQSSLIGDRPTEFKCRFYRSI